MTSRESSPSDSSQTASPSKPSGLGSPSTPSGSYPSDAVTYSSVPRGISRQFETARRVRSQGQTRTVWACDRCYRLKSKCDSGRPACATCIRGRFTCSYTARERGLGAARRGRRSTTVDAYVRMLEERLREVEQLIATGRRPSVGSSDSDRSTPVGSHNYRSPSDGRTTPTPAHNDPSRVSPGTRHHPSQSPSARPPPPSAAVFAQDVLEDMLRIYFDYVAVRWFHPPAHRRTFMAKPLSEHSPFLIYSIAAQSAPYSEHPAVKEYIRERQLPLYRAGEPYYYRARGLIAELLENPTFETVWGLSLIGIAATRMGEPSASAFYAMSIRMAVVLNMYIDPDVEEVHGPLPWLVKEARRRMWFTLCALDVTDCSPEDRARIIAERDQPILDRTPFIHDYTRRVRVPAPDHMWESVHTEEGLPAIGAFDPVQDLHCGDASGRLTRLYARIQILGIGVSEIVQNVSSNPRTPGRRELMDTTPGTSQSHAQTAQPLLSPEHQELIDQIEQELHTWLTYLPPWARSIDHHTTFVPSTISRHPPPWQLLSLHIMYHACYVALHLPTLLKARRNGVRSTHPSLAHVNATTRHHTRRISQLIHKVKNLDPSAKYITLIICYFTFYSAVALALALSDEYNREDTAELRAELDIHIWWMSVFGERWYMGGYLVRVIEGLAGDQAIQRERER